MDLRSAYAEFATEHSTDVVIFAAFILLIIILIILPIYGSSDTFSRASTTLFYAKLVLAIQFFALLCKYNFHNSQINK